MDAAQQFAKRLLPAPRLAARERQVRRAGFVAGALLALLLVGGSWVVSVVHARRGDLVVAPAQALQAQQSMIDSAVIEEAARIVTAPAAAAPPPPTAHKVAK